MLAPVTMVPSSVSSAAPTLKCEKSACAFFRARAAAAISFLADPGPWPVASGPFLDPFNNPLQQRGEGAAHALCRPQHVRMIDRLRQHAGCHVGDARDAEDLESHVARRDRFGHGRHADRIRANRAEEAYLG